MVSVLSVIFNVTCCYIISFCFLPLIKGKGLPLHMYLYGTGTNWALKKKIKTCLSSHTKISILQYWLLANKPIVAAVYLQYTINRRKPVMSIVILNYYSKYMPYLKHHTRKLLISVMCSKATITVI